jgi:toxin secretion/phage lysis holin
MDNLIKTALAAGGSVVSYLFGGWSYLLTILLTFVVIDYITGIAAAGKEGKLSSDAGTWGIAKKVLIFVMVTIAHLVDQIIGNANLLRDAAIFFYMSNELISILENIGRLGVPIPPAIRKAIELLKEKEGKDK